LSAYRAGKLALVRSFRTGLPHSSVLGTSAGHPQTGPCHTTRWRWPAVGAAVLALTVLGACSPSKYQYESNSSVGTYLRVPSDWKKFTQNELIGAELQAARQANQPSSLIDTLVNRQFQWRVAFDSDPSPSLDHTLALAEQPVVEVSVRSLDATEHDQVSLAALRNVVVNYDEQKQMAADEAAKRSVGVGGASTSNFRPIDEEELHLADGVHGIRLRYVLRPEPTAAFFAFDQTTLVDSKSERLYVLIIRSSERQFLEHNKQFTEIAKSFTVKPKG